MAVCSAVSRSSTLFRGSSWCTKAAAASPCGSCLPGCASLLVRSGARRLEVTLRDDVLLSPQSKPGDCLARDGQASPLWESNPMRLRGCPTPSPTALRSLTVRDLLLGGLQLRQCYPKPAASVHLFSQEGFASVRAGDVWCGVVFYQSWWPATCTYKYLHHDSCLLLEISMSTHESG